MAFSRAVAPAVGPGHEDLTTALVGIGFNLAARRPKREPNIEDTLLFAAVEGMESADLRVLALLVTWFGVHSAWVNAERLTRLTIGHPSSRVRALWAALGRWQQADRRFARMATAYRGPRIAAAGGTSDFLVRRHGEDRRFRNGPLLAAANLLRDRPEDVLTPATLAACHSAYRLRVIIGPTYRADMWAALEQDAALSTAELARAAYGSFATAWRVKRDFALLNARPVRQGAAGK
jgi:hypothetical protein